VLAPELAASHRSTLSTICDTVVPRIEREPDPDGFWARRGSEVGADAALADLLSALPEDRLAGVIELLEGLAEQGFERASQASREQLLRNVALLGPEAAAGVSALVGAALFLAYSLPDPETGRNPFWERLGYPGPASPPPPPGPKAYTPLVPDGERLELDADVVVVGSGAGGGVIAASLAAAGRDVVVLEAGGLFDESDFNQLELWAYQNLYYRGGPVPTADGNVSLQAGSSLGGGTTINWMNCLRTTPWVRDEWAGEYGLEGVDGAEYDRHLDAVLERISANEDCSDFNGPTLRLKEGAERLGWSFARVARNADPAAYAPETAGYAGFGDQSGSKQSTAKTFLRDAVAAGARIMVRTTATRVLTAGGRAAGVEARFEDPETGRLAEVAVHAPQVVVACGALESPALLLRSGIGGPAVGDHLHLHPCTAMLGVYSEDQRAWWGAPHTGVVDEFADTGGGWGFLLETAQYTTGIGASAVPFTSGLAHKEALAEYRFCSTSIALLRDRGHGRVTIDREGAAQAAYALADETDLRNGRHGLEAMARIHEAAGAREVRAMAAGAPRWRRGDDLAAFIARAQRIPLRFGGHRLFSAHQMGTCRMGTDPETSVAGPWGELHDTPGVWVGDGSAFPSASGTNPMISIMALAHRTAEAIAAAAPNDTGAAPRPAAQATPTT
jgi:choline dehydrogenase-like flavoprotein